LNLAGSGIAPGAAGIFILLAAIYTMIDHIFLRWIFSKLDESLLRQTYARQGQNKLVIVQEGATAVISSPARGFAGSIGGQRLAFLAFASILVTVGIPITIAALFFLHPERFSWAVVVSVSVVTAITAIIAWVTLCWTRAATREAVTIHCQPDVLRVKRSSPAVTEIEIPVELIKDVMITDQFKVSLELLVITHEPKVHRLLSGLSRAELEEAASFINLFRQSE
jgi:hypothetical protein